VVTGPRRHAAESLARVAALLDAAGARPRDLAGIVVADGPGSFTGLRIGWSLAKGLAQERDIPVRAIPALLAAAAGGATLIGGGRAVVACFDALRGQVFGAMYAFADDAVVTLLAPRVLTIGELIALAPERPSATVGDGAVRYAAELTDWVGAAPLPVDTLPAGAVALLQLVTRTGVVRVVDATSEPVYGRPAEAQARWEARHGRALQAPPGDHG
jgi:tRNA threonylcarbamoyladenosine biosynthesis protein TsaB